MNTRIIYSLLALVCLQLSFVMAAENLLKNPDFEEVLSNQLPAGWSISNNAGADVALDDQIFHSGSRSLRISGVTGYVSCQQSFGDIATLDSDYRLSGWVKYDNVRNDTVNFKTYGMPFLGIWTNTKTHNSLTFNALPFPPGSHEWQRFEKIFRYEDIKAAIEQRRFDTRPVRWAIRINIANQPGTVWFDDLSLTKLEPPANIDAALHSREYFAGQRNASLTIMLKNAAADQAAAIELQIHSTQEQVLFQQKLTIGANEMQVTLPTSTLPVGSYQLLCLPEDDSLQACELRFNVVPDPFAD
jgi:hypothetical protein